MPFARKLLHGMRTTHHRELGRATYEAKQVEDEVIVTATGDAPTPNYKIWLSIGVDRQYPPIIELWWMQPASAQLQLLTPFSSHITVNVGDRPIPKIQVRDANGIHEIAVTQTKHPGSTHGGKPQPVSANSFRLMLDDVHVLYLTSNLIGVPILHIGDEHYAGDELLIEDTALGQQVTVVTSNAPDLHVKTFTLIVPTVLLDGFKPVKVEMLGVFATHHTTIAGPVAGQNTDYVPRTLQGVAELIVS
jgi:hypothetical protein